MLGSRAAGTITVLAVVFLAACGTLDRINAPQKTGLTTPDKSSQPAGIALEETPLDGNYSLDNGHLAIRDDSGTVSVYAPLREGVKVETPGRAWVLEKSVEGHRATPVLDGTRITLWFDGGTLRTTGTLGGSAGCNTYAAHYKLGNDFVSATPGEPRSRRRCAPPQPG